jgi:hypothetical protein
MNETDILEIHPVQQTFLYFFAGLSNDTLARSMPYRSPLLPGILEDAESHYLKAQQSLPGPSSNPEFNTLYPIDEHEETAFSFTSGSVRHSLGSQTSNSSTIATSVSGGLNDSFDSSLWDTSPVRKASPLHVRKHYAIPRTPPKQVAELTSLFSPTASTRSSPQKLSSFSFFTPESSPENNDRHFLPKYNEDLSDFAEMLANHLFSIQTFRRNAEATHDQWRPSSPTGLGTKMLGPEEKTVRIARGRARGWARPRFNAQRYQDLCERAIAEL